MIVSIVFKYLNFNGNEKIDNAIQCINKKLSINYENTNLEKKYSEKYMDSLMMTDSEYMSQYMYKHGIKKHIFWNSNSLLNKLSKLHESYGNRKAKIIYL